MIKKITIFIIMASFNLLSLFSQDNLVVNDVANDEATCVLFKLRSETAGKICDLFQDFSKYKDYYDYGKKYAKDIEEERTPKKPPTNLRGATTLKGKLIKVRDNVKNLEIPNEIETIKLNESNAEGLIDKNIEIRREAIKELLKYTKERNESLNKIQDLQKGLTVFKKQVSGTVEITDSLKETLWKAFSHTGNGWSELSNVFGFAAYDLELHISPLIKKIRSEINKKNKKLEEILITIEPEQKNLKSNVSLLLTNEYNNLNQRLIELESDMEEVNSQARYFELKTKRHNRTRARLDERDKKLNLNFERLKGEEQKIKNEVRDFNKMINLIPQKENELRNFNYTGCPRRNSYYNCNHSGPKNKFDRDKNLKRNKIIELKESIRNKEIRIKSLKKEQNQKVDQWNQYFKALNTEFEIWYRDNEKIEQERKLVLDKFKETIDENGKIENLLKQNSNDANSLQELN